MVDIVTRQIESPGVDSVIKHGYCVGCGACTAIPHTKYTMVMTPQGSLEARPLDAVSVDKDVEQAAGRVCPFSDNALNEDQLAAELFSEASTHEKLGRFTSTYVGYVNEGEYRQRGSSGGMGTWLLEQLMIKGMSMQWSMLGKCNTAKAHTIWL